MKVGDEVYLVYDDTRRVPRHVTIKSIGHKYITVSGVHSSESKYDILTKRSVDDTRGWNCKAQLYESVEQYNEQQLENLVIHELKTRIVFYLQHKSIAPEVIHTIAKLLHINSSL